LQKVTHVFFSYKDAKGLLLKSSVADPDPVPFFTSGSGMGKKSRSGSEMNIPDHIFESLETIFGGLKIIKFFDADTQSF
jgi:hypothetical protein